MINNVYSTIKDALCQGYHKYVFTGCGLGIFSCADSEQPILLYCGRDELDKNSKMVDVSSYFDVASLTKPLLTLPALAVLLSQGSLSLCDSLVDILNVPEPGEKKSVTIGDLVAHRSGLPAHRPFFNELINIPREERTVFLLDAILKEESGLKRGEYLYSDLDYMLLGFVVEKMSGMNLYDFWEKMVIYPMGWTDDFHHFDESEWFSKRDIKCTYVATGLCHWSKKPLQGIVHDDNCRAFGKTMGHAGLFATLTGVVDICRMILQMIEGTFRHPFIDQDVMQILAGRMFDDEHWALGFDVPTGVNPSCGNFFQRDKTIGHLGFTGTSFWIDRMKKRGIVLLTNRVLVDKDGLRIRRFRPFIYDRVMKAFSSSGM